MSVEMEIAVVPLSALAAHGSRADCWMAHNGLVYDVTKFLEDHPGGPEIMMEHAGMTRSSNSGADCNVSFGISISISAIYG